MRTILLSFVFLVIAGFTQDRNIEFPRFTVKFPATGCEVKKEENKISLLGELTVTHWTMHRKEEGNSFLYMVASTQIPESLSGFLTMDTMTLNIALQTLLQSSASQFGGTDFTFKEFSHNGYEGLEATCKIENEGGDLKGRAFKIGNHVYVICGGGKPIDLRETDRFLNSFKLKNE